MNKHLILSFCATLFLLLSIGSSNAAENTAGGNDLRSLFTAGDAAYKKGKYAEGLEKLLAAQKLANTPWYKFAIDYRLAQCYYYTKKYEESFAAAKSALNYKSIGNKDHNLMTNRAAESLLQLKKYDDAMQIVKTQLGSEKREKSNYYLTMLLEGRILMEQKKFQEADQAFEKCQNYMKLSAMEQAKLYWYRGVNSQNANDLNKARDYYKKAVKLDGKWFSKDAQRRLDLLDKKGAEANNLLPDGSFEYCAGRTWNRMIDLGYAPGDFFWSQDSSTAFHGQYSLRSNGTQPLLLAGEGKFTNGYFSIYLKSPEAGAKVRVEFFAYKSFDRTLLASQVFELTNSWTRYLVKLKYIWLPVDQASTPFVIAVTPLTDKTVYADAAQLETTRFLPYSDYRLQLLSSAEAQKTFMSRFAPQHKKTTNSSAQALPKEFKINAYYPVAAANVPVAVALPMQQGMFKGGSYAVAAAENGKKYPAEVEPVAYYHQDRSVRSAMVRFNADLQAGVNTFTIRPGKLPTPAVDAELPPMELFAADHTGKKYQSRELSAVKSFDNFHTARFIRRGILADDAGLALAGYSLYIEKNKTLQAFKINVTIYNLADDRPLVIRSAGINIKSKHPGKTASYQQFFTLADKTFTHTADDGPAIISGTGGTLLIREKSLRHPVELSLNNEGVFTGYLYPPQAAALYLSRKMSLSREFIFSYNSNPSAVANQLGYRCTAMADADEFTGTNFLSLPVKKAVPAQKFAYSKFKKLRNTMLLTPQKILNHPKKHILHGVFNYGDLYGDRGWGNLESYLDMAEILYAIGMNDPEVMASGLNRATHYRDVDIVDGSAVIHGPNHSGGFIYEFSHSWPQGVILHYLLTGDERSWEVIQRTAMRYMATPIDYKHIADSRSLGRYLLGLADMYCLTGDKRLKERFIQQVKFAEKTQLGAKVKDQTIFHWNGRTDPFHVWYGACALMQMYQATGDESILQAFKREVDASLNMDFFRLDLQELWSGLPVEKTLPIQLGYHSHHRGSLIYPLLDFYSRQFNKPEYRKLAARAAYAEFLNGTPYPEPMDILRTNVLAEADEKSLLEEVLTLRRTAAADGFIRNGDFSLDSQWFRNWHLPGDRQMSYDELMEAWPLKKEKNYKANAKYYSTVKDKVSPWRSYSRNLAYMDHQEYFNAPPALNITLGHWYPSGNTAWLDSAPAYLKPGKWKLSGAYKTDLNINPITSVLVMNFTPEKEETRAYRFKPGNLNGNIPIAVWYSTPCLKNPQATVAATHKNGWKTFEFTFENHLPGIAVFRAIYRLANGKDRAEIWLDDIKLERIK